MGLLNTLKSAVLNKPTTSASVNRPQDQTETTVSGEAEPPVTQAARGEVSTPVRPIPGQGRRRAGEKRRVLFVDDDLAALQGIERGLTPFRVDLEPVFAGNLVRTKELLTGRFYDGIVASLSAPEQSVELLRQVAEQAPSTLRFLRAPAQDQELLKQCGQPAPVFLLKESGPETAGYNIVRAFRLMDWAGSDSLRKLIAQLTRLPSLPTLYTQVLSELAKPEPSIQFVGRLISKDPAMTAKILQMVNSTVFALASHMTDPVEAVLYLGVERTKGLILLASVMLQFEKSSCPGFSLERFWQHSLAVAAFARAVAMAQTKDVKLAELAYTAGLLHDVGKLLLAANLPEDYSQVMAQALSRNLPVQTVEREIFDACHAQLGAAVLGTWGLPVEMLEAIAWHHHPEESSNRSFSILTAVHVANAVEHEKRLHQAGTLASQINFEYIERLGLSDRRNGWRETCGFHVQVEDDPHKEKIRRRQEART